MPLDELSDARPAAPMDGPGQNHDAFPLLDDVVLHSGGLADVVDTAAFWSSVSDSFKPWVGLSAMLSEFTAQAAFGLAPALAGIEVAVPRLPNIAEMVGQSLLEGLGTRNAALSVLADVRPQFPSLSETVNSVLPSVVSTLGLLDGLNPTRAILSVVEPQVSSLASAVGPVARLSSMADAFQPLVGFGELVRQSNLGLAPVFEGLPALLSPLPSLAKVTETLAPCFAIQVGVPRIVQEALRTLPSMADFIGGHMADLFAGVRSVADWAKWLRPSVLAEARYAFDAYMKGDPEPMKDFLRRCLRLWPVLEDHCQALAVAMFERSWEQEADLTDDQSVRRVLIRYARQGCDFERDHEIRGVPIGYIPEGWEQPDTVPGPEDLVIPRLIPWAQQFETAPVRYVAGRLDEQEQALVRAWSENHPMTWPKASDLVQQDEAQGERARRKLHRLGKEWRRRETLQELS
ncbi:hypothetical protein [Streptomyces drozdowiczii]|uniref:Uncharacterized protein n=1 Tax=Streptomyces drozdowiczii TaxID=202862 RepID=A0ABY6Q1L7_9ACTN|nr:hypothetical protein [Streptomyces drozdowiczii]MCX0241824.1 hypothetical protein [Streptomyces drozdowiczii]UZK58332.1 hypothetical protein NEH16_33425 [Streptomyces drozdowiczii]